MEQFFTSLTKRQTMLLLTSLAFGGSESVEAYTHLSGDEEELLKYRAKALLQIPRDKRIPVLVQEIKRLVTQRRKQLVTAEPKRLAEVLKGQRAALVQVVLSAVPAEIAESVRALIGKQAPVRLKREVRPEILSIIRWKLEEALRHGALQVGVFRFTDLTLLQQRELLAVADRMGARVLATAVAGLNDAEREEFLGKLPPDQKALAARAAEAGKARRLSEEDAKTVLSIYGALESPTEGLRSAGLQRIVRAAVAQGPEFARRLVERHPGEMGKLLGRWLKEEKNRPVKGDGGRADIVEQMERLSQKNVIDRPMRLPPPMRPPPAALKSSPALARPPLARALSNPGTPSVRLAAPALGPRPRTAERPMPERAAPERPPDARPRNDRPRMDPIAAREARRAGVGRPPDSQHGSEHGQGQGQGQGQAQRRIMRDGKPLERAAGPTPEAPPYPGKPGQRRPSLNPALQEIPRKKDRTEAPRDSGQHRSPVVKGPRRGPSGGSG